MKSVIGIFVVIMILIGCTVAVSAALSTSTTGFSSLVVRNATDIKKNDVGYAFVSQRPDPAEPGSYVEVRFKIENVGADEASNVLFEVMPKFPFSLDPDQDPMINVGQLGARQVGEEAYIIFYRLKIDEKAVQGNNELGFRYSKDNGRSWIQPDPFYVRIQTYDAILAVRSVSTSPEMIKPGQEAQVSLDVMNAADSLLQDITFKLDLSSSSFVPIGSTDEKYINILPSRSAANITFSLLAQVDAQSKVHLIPLTVTYTDDIGRNYSRKSSIGIVINDEPQFIVGLDESTITAPKTKGNVVIAVSNIGSAELKYLTAELMPSKGYVVLSNPQVYMGNLDSDDFDSAEFEIYVKEKKVDLLLKLAFKDSFNNEYTRSVTVPLPLYSSSEARRYGLGKQSSIIGTLISIMIGVVMTAFWIFMVMECLRTSMVRYKKYLWMLIVIGGYIVGALIFYVLIKRKKA